MFGDGTIKIIKDENGDLHINMWETVQHLSNSAKMMRNVEGPSLVSDTMLIIASTLCDVALYELGMDSLGEIDSVDSLIDLWDSHRE